MSLDQETRMYNEAWINMILRGQIKQAEISATNFLYTRVREDGMLRRIFDPIPVTKEDFVPQLYTDQPVIYVEKQPESPGAASFPFGDLTTPMYYIKGERFPVVLERISSPMLRKDEAELATYRADIRQLLAEMIVKDLTWTEDAIFIRNCNTVLGGAPGATNVLSGLVQWRQLPGGVSRTAIGDAFAYAFDPPSRIPITKILVNGAFTAQLFKFQRDELGGDDAQAVMFEGWGERKLNNATLCVTIKQELVPNNTAYFFGDPQFIGKFFVWQEPTMYIKKEDVMIMFRAHEIVGIGIGHGDGIHRYDFVELEG